jgi:hypothetical protein
MNTLSTHTSTYTIQYSTTLLGDVTQGRHMPFMVKNKKISFFLKRQKTVFTTPLTRTPLPLTFPLTSLTSDFRWRFRGCPIFEHRTDFSSSEDFNKEEVFQDWTSFLHATRWRHDGRTRAHAKRRVSSSYLPRRDTEQITRTCYTTAD